MMADPVKLPTASTAFYSVQKDGIGWALVLITPMGGKKVMRTKLRHFEDKTAAIRHGREVAVQQHRPFKIGGRNDG